MNLRIRRKSSSIVAEVGPARQEDKEEYSYRQNNNNFSNTSRTYEKPTTVNNTILNGPHGYQHNQLLFQAQCQQRRNISELLMVQSQNNSPQRQEELQVKIENYDSQEPRSSSSQRDKKQLGQVKVTRFFNFPINDSHKVMMAPKYAYPNYLQGAEKEKGRFLIPIKRVIDRVISNKSPLLVELHRKITSSEYNTNNTSQIEDDRSSQSSRNMPFVDDTYSHNNSNIKCTCNNSQANGNYNDYKQKINSFNTTYQINNIKNISVQSSSKTKNRSYNCSPSSNHSPKENYSAPGNGIIHQNNVNNSCRSSINGLFMQPRRKQLQQFGRLNQNQSHNQPWPYQRYNQQNQDSSIGGYYCPSPKQSPSRRQFAQVILDSPIKRRSLSTAEKISRNNSNQEQNHKTLGNSQVTEQKNNFMLSPYNLER